MFKSQKNSDITQFHHGKDKHFIQRTPHSKLKIISGSVTRANSQSKVYLGSSNLALQQLQELKQSGIQNFNSNSRNHKQKRNRKILLALSSKKQGKQHSNLTLNSNRQNNNLPIKNKNNQNKFFSLLSCQQVCRQSNQLNDKIFLQSPQKRNMRCSISLTNSQIQNDKVLFQNPQLKQLPIKDQTSKKAFTQNTGLNLRLNKCSRNLQNTLIQRNFHDKRYGENKKYCNLQSIKQSFNNIITEEPSFQIFDPTHNGQLNLTDISRPTIRESKDEAYIQSGRSTLIDLLKDLQQSQNNSIMEKKNEKFKPKVNFFY